VRWCGCGCGCGCGCLVVVVLAAALAHSPPLSLPPLHSYQTTTARPHRHTHTDASAVAGGRACVCEGKPVLKKPTLLGSPIGRTSIGNRQARAAPHVVTAHPRPLPSSPRYIVGTQPSVAAPSRCTQSLHSTAPSARLPVCLLVCPSVCPSARLLLRRRHDC
jgi:hypothetical protein